MTAQGSQWSTAFQVQNDDGSLADLTNKVFELVVRDRTDPAGSVLFSVNSTVPGTYGEIVVTLSSSTVQVVVNAAATVLLTDGGGPYTLWMDQGLPDATALVTGVFLAQVVAAP